MINKFDKEYDFLSNFYTCIVVYDGLTYKNTEAAFQAQKSKDPVQRVTFTFLNPSEAKKLGRTLKLREDWEDIKEQVMYEVCTAKFYQNKRLKDKLLETGNKVLIEGNTWHDNTWGNCTCEKCKGIEGKNLLGKTLMKIREELREN